MTRIYAILAFWLIPHPSPRKDDSMYIMFRDPYPTISTTPREHYYDFETKRYVDTVYIRCVFRDGSKQDVNFSDAATLRKEVQEKGLRCLSVMKR